MDVQERKELQAEARRLRSVIRSNARIAEFLTEKQLQPLVYAAERIDTIENLLLQDQKERRKQKVS